MAIPSPDAPQATYRCIACDAAWPYARVRHLARCPACGSGLQLVAPPAPSRL